MSGPSTVPTSVDPELPPPSGEELPVTGKVEFRSHWDYAWSRFKKDRFAFYGGVLALILVLISFGASLIAPADPFYQFPEGLSGEFAQPRAPGSDRFFLGTDSLGRDFLSRLIWGGRISLTVAIAANVISITVAVILGGIAGFLGGL